MALKIANKLVLYLLKDHTVGLLAPLANASNVQIVRHRRTKHWNPKFKLLRAQKVLKVDLPNFNEKVEEMSEEEIRSKMKEHGLLPPSVGGTSGAMQSVRFLEKKSKTMMAIRKIRQFEEEFDTPEFCAEATKIYIKMHEMLASKDKDNMIDVVTERAYPEVMHNIESKTIHWKYIKNIELPRVVQARCTDIISKENIFAQITVRFHTQQILAIYDRFGRLMHGSEILAKDVLEYVVFEKHLANEYGTWRVHAKIIPDWLPPKEPSAITYKQKTEPPTEEETPVVESSKDAGVSKESNSPSVA
ncbi:hypothetical protein NQ318_000935 [Aromia moschata]|uniref:Large ribosomal subunit protein mL45 n=1 Tax=Aromia moschata TaxID=1265417 RepID=A0AAV8ZEI5_9CUCU|nr:hypothetical protein NQ318_000935 [Aromia moschata]